MFNRTEYNSKSEVVAVTRVVEKSITPDKVTDMYDKVRAEVEDAIVKTYKVESAILNGFVFEVHYPTRELWTRFVLNGKDYFDKTFPTDSFALSPANAIKALQDHFNKVVAREVIIEAAKATKIK